MIQLVASDMDGTLLTSLGAIHPENVKAIHHLQKLGIPFVICSGRTIVGAQRFLQPHGITCPVIALNGAEIYTADGQLMEQIGLNKGDAQLLIQQMDQEGIYVELVTSKGIFTRNLADRERHLMHMFSITRPQSSKEERKTFISNVLHDSRYQLTNSFEPFFEDPSIVIQKMCAYTMTDQSLFKNIRATCEQKLDQLVITSSLQNNIEINHVRAQKGIALKRLGEHLGISLEHMMAFGDNLNDYSMLTSVGYGYAMENAEAQIKKVTPYHTASNNQAGVAQAIYQHFPK